MDDTTQQEPNFASEAFHNSGVPHDHMEELPPTGTDERPETEIPSEGPHYHSSPSYHQLRSGWFSNAHNLNISGGRFVKHIHHAVPAETPDFRVIPVGDLDLRREIRLNSATRVVDCRQGRRMHAARIYGSKSKMTVAIYEGDNAEENWREAVSQYSNFRHPNLVQLFGTARSPKIHAAVFHDELTPARQLVEEKYCDSSVSTVYFHHFLDVWHYMIEAHGSGMSRESSTLWIRPSTRTLCVELTPDYEYNASGFAKPETTHDFLLDASQVSKIIASMSLQHYYSICEIEPSLSNTYWLRIPKHSAVTLGAVNCLSGPNYEDSIEVAFSPDFRAGDWGWNDRDAGITLENHWTRLYGDLNTATAAAWLSQAKHIFKALKITSNLEEYAIATDLHYGLKLNRSADIVPAGYLFLCSLEEFQSDEPNRYKHPDCAAYWSLDSSGAQRLGTEEAENLGFPSIESTMFVRIQAWDASVYEGLCQFHEGKGFDPCSQEIARELGHPLYQLSGAPDASFAHIHESEDDEAIHKEISPVVPSAETTQTLNSSPTGSQPSDINSTAFMVPSALEITSDVPALNLTPSEFDTLFGSHWGLNADVHYTSQDSSAGPPFNFLLNPTARSQQLDALDSENNWMSSLTARTARKRDAEEEISEHSEKKLRLDYDINGTPQLSGKQ
ncbi:hypothetical protein B0H17DRAFT_1143791 [Mycena rosella]|uniref:Protein kinase domain-containing protein n=1 Tax=Mycena rosella TaxID=1033263 RepID=A0AAD7CXY8_MYCRO|nr:hypothetical protein B0H17DRAFT_1143791 [Mycena rosella]